MGGAVIGRQRFRLIAADSYLFRLVSTKLQVGILLIAGKAGCTDTDRGFGNLYLFRMINMISHCFQLISESRIAIFQGGFPGWRN
jgi:hypothetical protein